MGQIETYRDEIETMRHELEKVNSDNMSHILPKLQLISETYNSAIISQRKENVALQGRLTDLKGQGSNAAAGRQLRKTDRTDGTFRWNDLNLRKLGYKHAKPRLNLEGKRNKTKSRFFKK